MAKHTPTPWNVQPYNDGECFSVMAGKNEIACLPNTYPLQKQDASFIVLACNSYEGNIETITKISSLVSKAWLAESMAKNKSLAVLCNQVKILCEEALKQAKKEE